MDTLSVEESDEQPLLWKPALAQQVVQPLYNGSSLPLPQTFPGPGNRDPRLSASGSSGGGISSFSGSGRSPSGKVKVVKDSGRNYGSFGNNACTGSFIEYQVKKGDTLRSIALKNDISVENLKKINRLFSDEAFHLKQTLLLPCPDVIPVDSQLVSQDGAMALLDDIGSIEHKKNGSSSSHSEDKDTKKEANKNVPPSPNIDDIFSRFDSQFAVTKDKVEKLTLNSNYTPSPSGSEDSLSTRVQDPGSPARSMPLLSRAPNGCRQPDRFMLDTSRHDQFYKL